MAKKVKNDGTNYMPSKEPIFGLVKINEKVRIAAMGNNIVSAKEFETFKDAEDYIASKPYELIFNVLILVMNYEIKKQNAQKD